MKKRTLAAIGFACAIALTACNDDPSSSGDNPVVAIVDGEEITEEEFVDLLKERYGAATLEEMITLRLVNKAKDDVDISDEEIEKELDNFRTSFGTEDDKELLEAIKEQFDIELESIDALVDEYIIPPLVIQKLAVQDVNVTEEQKREYYEENKEQFEKQVEASHILVEDENTANEVLEKLKAGEDFAALAKEYSIDGTAASGGELGYFTKDKMVEPFSEAAFSMEVGEISDPVETEYGFHIIKVTGQKETYEDFEADIEEILIQQQSKSTDEVIAELMKKGNVVIKDARFSEILNK